jgi:hypothetical protein
MRRYLEVPKIRRAGKRAVAVALLGLLLGTLAAPATSSAATVRVHPPATHIGFRPLDGVGDSPLVP